MNISIPNKPKRDGGRPETTVVDRLNAAKFRSFAYKREQTSFGTVSENFGNPFGIERAEAAAAHESFEDLARCVKHVARRNGAGRTWGFALLGLCGLAIGYAVVRMFD